MGSTLQQNSELSVKMVFILAETTASDSETPLVVGDFCVVYLQLSSCITAVLTL
jgi:hypothetical protein